MTQQGKPSARQQQRPGNADRNCYHLQRRRQRHSGSGRTQNPEQRREHSAPREGNKK